MKAKNIMTTKTVKSMLIRCEKPIFPQFKTSTFIWKKMKIRDMVPNK